MAMGVWKAFAVIEGSNWLWFVWGKGRIPL